MKNLKNSFILSLIGPLIFGCQTSRVFQMENFEDLHVITTQSERLRQQCVYLNAEAENKWRHQYSMYILDNKNQVLEVMQSTHMDKDSCYSQMQEVEKLLKRDPVVKVCVRDKLERVDAANIQNELISFGSLGSHQPSYKPLTLDSICNSKKCIGDNSAWIQTCPGFVKQ